MYYGTAKSFGCRVLFLFFQFLAHFVAAGQCLTQIINSCRGVGHIMFKIDISSLDLMLHPLAAPLLVSGVAEFPFSARRLNLLANEQQDGVQTEADLAISAESFSLSRKGDSFPYCHVPLSSVLGLVRPDETSLIISTTHGRFVLRLPETARQDVFFRLRRAAEAELGIQDIVPVVIWKKILAHLPDSDWGKALRVCSQWYLLGRDQANMRQTRAGVFFRFKQDSFSDKFKAQFFVPPSEEKLVPKSTPNAPQFIAFYPHSTAPVDGAIGVGTLWPATASCYLGLPTTGKRQKEHVWRFDEGLGAQWEVVKYGSAVWVFREGNAYREIARVDLSAHRVLKTQSCVEGLKIVVEDAYLESSLLRFRLKKSQDEADRPWPTRVSVSIVEKGIIKGVFSVAIAEKTSSLETKVLCISYAAGFHRNGEYEVFVSSCQLGLPTLKMQGADFPTSQFIATAPNFELSKIGVGTEAGAQKVNTGVLDLFVSLPEWYSFKNTDWIALYSCDEHGENRIYKTHLGAALQTLVYGAGGGPNMKEYRGTVNIVAKSWMKGLTFCIGIVGAGGHTKAVLLSATFKIRLPVNISAQAVQGAVTNATNNNTSNSNNNNVGAKPGTLRGKIAQIFGR